MSDDALIETVSRSMQEKFGGPDGTFETLCEAFLAVARPIIEAPLRAENEKLRAALKRWEDTGLQKDWPITYDAALKETGDE